MKKTLFTVSIIASYLFAPPQDIVPKKQGKLWGYVNEADSFVIAPRYTAVGEFLSGYAWVNIGGKTTDAQCPIGGKWGIVDFKGNEVCPVQYDYVDHCANNMVAVNIGGIMDAKSFLIRGGKWGFFNLETKKEITPIQYDQVGAFIDCDVAWVQKGGTLVKKIRYDEIKNEKDKIIGEKRTFDVFSDFQINKLFDHYNASGTWALIDKTRQDAN